VQQEYDVVVIGSGIGGLGVGALLSHRGYKTLVVEKLERIGGRCSTEEYEGFKLSTGAMTWNYEGTEMEEVFKEVGVEVELIDIPRLLYRIEGKDYEMPLKGALTAALDIISKLEEGRVKVAGGFAKAPDKDRIMEAWRRAAKEPEKEAGLTFKDWLLQYTDNELVHGLFDIITLAIMGAHHYEMPASDVFTFMVKMKGFRNLSLPPRGNIVPMEALAKVIRANGDVWTNCPAKRILIRGNEAKAVVVQRDGGEVEIPSQVVISDIGPKMMVELAGEENFNEGYQRMMRLRLWAVPVTICFIASDRPLWPEDGSPATLMLIGARRLHSAVPLSNMSPELAPPGQHLMFATGRPVSVHVHMDSEVEQEQMRLDLMEQFPLFEKHGRILKMVSKDISDELPEDRVRVGNGMPVETPVRNLFEVSDATVAPGYIGAIACMESAKRVAEIIRKRFKPGQT